MYIQTYIQLKDFDFWSGALVTRHLLTDDEMDYLEDILMDLYPDGIDETELNDIFWFDDEFIANSLGYDDYEQFWEERNK